jgi:ketosteroid isomerase-like protein
MSTEKEVHKASEQFYAALNRLFNGNADSMEGIWSHDPSTTVLHPIGGRTVGWDDVREAYRDVAQIAEKGYVKLDDQIIQIIGDVAYEVGVERGQATFAGNEVTLDYRVTNIYRNEAGGWKIVHHHTDISPAMLEFLNQT